MIGTVTEPDDSFDLFGTDPVESLTGQIGQAPSKALAELAGVAGSSARPKLVKAVTLSPATLELASQVPDCLHLGTSTWSFPGWEGIVYGAPYSKTELARNGLAAYAKHPLLRCASIDRSFYAPLSVADYASYADQVPIGFRFIVKGPSAVTDAMTRGPHGDPQEKNSCFLNAEIATRDFVSPCIAGLGAKAGALVFQFPPMPTTLLAEPVETIDRIGHFLAALPSLPNGVDYAVELRDACLLTPRLIKMLRASRARYCVGVHARMPDLPRQAAALALLDQETAGPLIVRWSLHAGFKYEQARQKYQPFDRLVDPDIATRQSLAALARRYLVAGQPVFISINNKAEGSAPLSCFELAHAIAALA
jgi:uncharacterized protein YecE (DUF72 family)